MTEESSYSLRVSFGGVFKSHEEECAYVYGWEAGCISRDMQSEEDFERTVHEENKTILSRLCDSEGFEVTFSSTQPPADGWLVARFKRRPHIRHLAVVK